ncbi:nuclease-related domain-containing protein [Halalkalibacter nanhaiisediminis]|uniref:Nuclease-like protein n=1 Tax=Halalkalibacter nanhaiisediminis TaxID=688079 RepID=A0A562QT30_9BACI|nr:nuclease-related domain-containing protein [Halalkalibacter nanhaiisediminis]TWI59847.1 nuclease-like protein [Halalkalibacter nanhaiisediminis]
MITKERKRPLKIQKLEALLRRLPSHHPKYEMIKEALAKSIAGFRGEQSLDYYLSFLPSNEFLILHDIRFPYDENSYFQLDTLILSTRFLVILEVKNIAGTLYFDQAFQQLIRILDGKEEGFLDPLLQIKRQHMQLETWLAQRKNLPLPPIESFIVISHPSTIIKSSPNHKEAFEKVIRPPMIPLTIEHLKRFHTKEILPMKPLKRLATLIQKQHTPSNPDLLHQFQIDKSELLRGVICPTCMRRPLVRKRGSWYCPYCESSSKDAHVSSLQDYFLLIGPTISNQQLRDFLQISSATIAKKLLVSLDLKQSGVTKGRTYELETLLNHK